VSEQPPELRIVVPPAEAPLALTDALAGVRLSDADQEVLAWLRRQRDTRIAVVVALLEKVRQAGYTEGYNDARDDLNPDTPTAGDRSRTRHEPTTRRPAEAPRPRVGRGNRHRHGQRGRAHPWPGVRPRPLAETVMSSTDPRRAGRRSVTRGDPTAGIWSFAQSPANGPDWCEPLGRNDRVTGERRPPCPWVPGDRSADALLPHDRRAHA
jgi:hypothetical protein